MTRRRPYSCTCHSLSPFLWYLEDRPSIFRDLNRQTNQSRIQSEVVEKKREQGQDISHISGLSEVSHARRITDFKQFTVYSRARASK
jgi:hypothetical protein